MSEFTSIWFEKVIKLDMNEALFFRVADKKEQTALANEFEKERSEYSTLDPVHASQIFVTKTLKDRNQYVVLERKFRTPFTAFLRDGEGKFSKITIDPSRNRMLRLMLKECKSRKEIEEALNGLTDEEVVEFFPG